MRPERWKRVTELFEAALEQEPSGRVDFLARAAEGDATLAQEVLRMLASDENSGAFLNAPHGFGSLGLPPSDPMVVPVGLIEADPNNSRLQRDLFVTLRSEGNHLFAMGKKRESLASYTRAAALAEAQLAADPRNRWNQFAVVMAGSSLGTALVEPGQTGAGVDRLRQAARAAEPVVAEDPDNAFMRNQLAAIYTHLGSALRGNNLGERAMADRCQFLERAVKMWNALGAEGRASGEHQVDRDQAVAGFSRCPGQSR